MIEVQFADDVKLMGYGESDTSGCWIKLQILDEHMPVFRGQKGEIFECVLKLKTDT